MALLETLTINLGAAITKAIAKLWLHDNEIAHGVADGLVDIFKKHFEDFETRRATEKLFEYLKDEIARRLEPLIDDEFPSLPEHDRIAAALAVAELFQKLNLSYEIAAADLDAARLESKARKFAQDTFSGLGGDSKQLAEFILAETCAYIVSLAGKLPNYQVAATREILKRTTTLLADLSKVLEEIVSMRVEAAGKESSESARFETRYRRSVADKLDRLQMFGARLIGAGAREYELSVAYITLKSAIKGSSGNVDTALSGCTLACVRGEAGSGKTTLLQWIAVRAARQDFHGPLKAWNSRLPFYIRLRDYVNQEFPIPEKMIGSVTPNHISLMPSQKWAAEVLDNNALVLADGIDEIPTARRGDMFSWLKELVEDFPNAIFVVSSRGAALDSQSPQGSFAERLSALSFDVLTLEPMSLTDSEALVAQWHAAVGRDLLSDSDDRLMLEKYERDLRSAIRDRPAIRSLASNPLLCSMICALNWVQRQNMPDDRMELYKLALTLLLERRDADRNIQSDLGVGLKPTAKQALLDNLAYWMLRNGISEETYERVLSQVTSLVPRYSNSASPLFILQDLIERSGILRQPQHGLVDFSHRTFLEFMGARAAIESDDTGFLVEKAQHEDWRETIVFAAGHAKGESRNRLIKTLLKRQVFWRARPIEADVTAACCLETTGTDLDPTLLHGLQECAKRLFPPKDLNEARILAPAARLAPNLLFVGKGSGQAVHAACIRCASYISADAVRDAIEHCINITGDLIDREILFAWQIFFDQLDFVEITKKRFFRPIKGASAYRSQKDFISLDSDTRKCMNFLAVSGFYDGLENFTAMVRKFSRDRQLAIDSRYNVLSLANAHRLGELRSLKSLFLPLKYQTGSLEVLANLERLNHLKLRVDCRKVSTLKSLASLPFLQEFDLTLDDEKLPLNGSATENLDLRFIGSYRELRALHLRSQVCLFLATISEINSVESLSLWNVLPAFSSGAQHSKLASLKITVSHDLVTTIDLGNLMSLKSLQIETKGKLFLTLPSSVERLELYCPGSATVFGVKKLQRLYTLKVQSINTIVEIFRDLPQVDYFEVRLAGQVDFEDCKRVLAADRPNIRPR